MADNLKPGGGNKPQPYIPAGNGDKSGEYTDKPSVKFPAPQNIIGKYNFYSSKLVKKVSHVSIENKKIDVPLHYVPNTVVKRIEGNYVVSERYYNEMGDVYLDIDYTDHGNPKTHPHVPHIHRWEKGLNGKFKRGHWEKFI